MWYICNMTYCVQSSNETITYFQHRWSRALDCVSIHFSLWSVRSKRRCEFKALMYSWTEIILGMVMVSFCRRHRDIDGILNASIQQLFWSRDMHTCTMNFHKTTPATTTTTGSTANSCNRVDSHRERSVWTWWRFIRTCVCVCVCRCVDICVYVLIYWSVFDASVGICVGVCVCVCVFVCQCVFRCADICVNLCRYVPMCVDFCHRHFIVNKNLWSVWLNPITIGS